MMWSDVRARVRSQVLPFLHLRVVGQVVEEEGGGVGGGVDPGQEEILHSIDHVPGVQLPRGQPVLHQGALNVTSRL